MAATTEAEMIGLVEDFLCAVASDPDPNVDLVASIVADIAADAQVVRVDRLTSRYALNERRLQRLFAGYVGVSPKTVIRRMPGSRMPLPVPPRA